MHMGDHGADKPALTLQDEESEGPEGQDSLSRLLASYVVLVVLEAI